jgi:hypothetical protein
MDKINGNLFCVIELCYFDKFPTNLHPAIDLLARLISIG